MGSPVRSTIAGSLFASAFGKAVDGELYLPISLRAKSVAVLTAGAPADIAIIPIASLVPAITRWYIKGNTGVTTVGYFVNETQVGTMAAGTMAAFDTAAGGGQQLFATTAPQATSPAISAWSASAATVMSSTGSIFIRQMVNSANAGTISFYITIYPIP